MQGLSIHTGYVDYFFFTLLCTPYCTVLYLPEYSVPFPFNPTKPDSLTTDNRRRGQFFHAAKLAKNLDLERNLEKCCGDEDKTQRIAGSG